MAAVAPIADTPDPLGRVWNDICELGMESNVADLDAHGFTVVPPEIANPNGMAERMLNALLDIAEKAQWRAARSRDRRHPRLSTQHALWRQERQVWPGPAKGPDSSRRNE